MACHICVIYTSHFPAFRCHLGQKIFKILLFSIHIIRYMVYSVCSLHFMLASLWWLLFSCVYQQSVSGEDVEFLDVSMLAIHCL